jgi:hypothetical protein
MPSSGIPIMQHPYHNVKNQTNHTLAADFTALSLKQETKLLYRNKRQRIIFLFLSK